MSEWCIFEWKTATPFTVIPDTKENAEHELSLLDEPGHEVMLYAEAQRLGNAWAHGRMWQVEQDRRRVEISDDELWRVYLTADSTDGATIDSIRAVYSFARDH